MPVARSVQRAPTVERRRPAAAPAVVQRSAVPSTPPARSLQERLGNQGTQALIARSTAAPPRESGSVAPPAVSSIATPTVQLSAAGGRPLEVSKPTDPAEKEAEETAKKVMRMAEPPATPFDAQQKIGGSTQPVHRVASADGVNQVSAPVAANIHTMQGGGAPLPAATRAKFEPRFGADFSRVRVHTGNRADSTAKAISAKAFTVGSDIVFASGQYSPESHEGQHLLAHELTHVVQQNAGGSRLNRHAERVDPGIVTANHAPTIQRAWYNFNIPFTDYQFDPSIEGVKTAAGVVKDAAVEGLKWIVDEITSLVSSGLEWLSDQWDGIKASASSAFNAARNSFSNIISLITNPLGFLADALMNLDAGVIARAWATFSRLVSTVANGFKVATDTMLSGVNRIWGVINGYATSLLNRVAGLTNNFLFKKLPGALQQVAVGFVNRLKNFWKKINDGWNALFTQIKTWVEGALDTVFSFVRRVLSFGINVVIAGIIEFGKIVLFLKDFFSNPMKYVAILAQRAVQAFSGVQTRFAGLIGQYFGSAKAAAPAAPTGLKVQRQPSSVPAEAKTSATWSEIGHGIGEMMGKKWDQFKSNPLSIITGLLLDMVLPIVGNVKDVIQLFKDIKRIVTGPLSAGSLEELWTSLLLILDIPILIYHTVVSILMRTLMLPLIVASFVRHPIVTAIASAVGYALLGAFVQVEMLNLGQKLLLLKTGVTTKAQKEEAYNRVADSLIALAMTAAIILLMLLLHFIANVMKGIYNFVKGKVFGIEPAQPKQLGPGPPPPKQLGPGPAPPKQLGPGPAPPKQLGPGPAPPKQLGPGPAPPKQLGPGPAPPKQLPRGPAKPGSVIETRAKFSAKERRIADVLVSEGKTVEAVPRSTTERVRSGDALVDGRLTEFKSMDSGATSATVRNEVNNSVRGGGQARDMILDARGSGLSEAEAVRGLNRASGITRGRIDSVRIVGDGYDIKRNFP